VEGGGVSATVPRWQGRLHFKRRTHRLLRVAVFARDHFTCQVCGWRPEDHQIPEHYDGRYAIGTYPNPKADRTLHVDHVFPRALGGPPVLDNLQTLCEACNCSKADKVAA
jgi:5-methylcytosine-specific restriction endonuclease McrA